MGETTRREWMRGSLAAAGVASLGSQLFSLALPPLGEDEASVAFLDPQPVNPDRSMVIWEQLKSWITPQKDFFSVKHYGIPEVDSEQWSLGISGLVSKPRSFTLEDLKARPRQEYAATLECSGNGASERFMGAIGNAVWGGTPLGSSAAGMRCPARRHRGSLLRLGPGDREDTRQRVPAELWPQPLDRGGQEERGAAGL